MPLHLSDSPYGYIVQSPTTADTNPFLLVISIIVIIIVITITYSLLLLLVIGFVTHYIVISLT